MDKGVYFSNMVSKGDMLFQKVLAFFLSISLTFATHIKLEHSKKVRVSA